MTAKKQTLSERNESLAEQVENLQQANKELADTNKELAKPMSIHQLLDASIDYLKDNKFYTRGVNSGGIASLVRSAREKLRIATKK